jgi:hypothetical protein
MCYMWVARFNERPQVLFDQVRVAHCGAQISVAHRLFDVHGILSLREPRSDAPVPQVVRAEVCRHVRALVPVP